MLSRSKHRKTKLWTVSFKLLQSTIGEVMPSNGARSTNKPPESLQRQVGDVTDYFKNTSIVPPSVQSEIFGIQYDSLKESFPLRCQWYREALRACREIGLSSEEAMHRYSLDHQRHIRVLSALNNLDTYASSVDSKESTPLWNSQFETFIALRKFFESGEKSGYVKLPTGAGKTVIFVELAHALRLKTLIVVPTRQLVYQTDERIAQFAPDLDVGMFLTNGKKIGRDVTIITYASFLRAKNDPLLNLKTHDLIILDEAHEGLGEKRSKLVARLAEDRFVLGFTATPAYSASRSLATLLGQEIASMSIREAVSIGLLCPFSVILAKTQVDLRNIRVTRGEYSKRDLEKVLNTQALNQAAVQLYLQQFNGERAIAFCSGVGQAKELARLFSTQGVAAEAVWGADRHSWSKVLRHRRGQSLVLCNAKLLGAGHDDPGISVCFNVSPTLSPLKEEQRSGRVLRIDPSNSSKHATIVSFLHLNNAEQVTFSEILGAAEFLGPERGSSCEEQQGSGSKRDIKDFKPIPGLEVVVDPVEVMRVVNSIVAQRALPRIPPTWKTINSLCNEWGRKPSTVEAALAPYRDSHPQHFDSFGTRYQYISPEVVNMVASSLEAPPEGWMVLTALGKTAGVGAARLKKFVDGYRTSHPAWFYEYRNDKGLFEHFAPQLVELAIEHYSSLSPTPPGWLAPSTLGRLLETDPKSIRKVAETFRNTNPKWFQEFYASNGHVGEYYSPLLVNQLKEIFSAPLPGWRSQKELAQEFECSPSLIAIVTRPYRESRSDLFRRFLSSETGLKEYYSPEFVEILKEHIRPPPPKDWVTPHSLGYGKQLPQLKEAMKLLREEMPDHFKLFRTLAGTREHLSPQAATVLQARCRLRK